MNVWLKRMGQYKHHTLFISLTYDHLTEEYLKIMAVTLVQCIQKLNKRVHTLQFLQNDLSTGAANSADMANADSDQIYGCVQLRRCGSTIYKIVDVG